MGSSLGSRWETDVYGTGAQLNLYPFDVVVSLVMSNFFLKVPDRSAIKILDMGSGAGNHLWFLAREGFNACGIDGSALACAFARAKLKAGSLSADVRQGDFTSLPWEDQSFDFVADRSAIPATVATVS